MIEVLTICEELVEMEVNIVPVMSINMRVKNPFEQ
jgi:hypothetical protein